MPIVAHVADVERELSRSRPLDASARSSGTRSSTPRAWGWNCAVSALAAASQRRRPEPRESRFLSGLSGLARSLGLPVHRPHHADGDALTTAQAFIALATHLDAFGAQTLGSLRAIAQPPATAGRLRSTAPPIRPRPEPDA